MRAGTMTILFREQLGTDEHIGYVESLERIHKSGFSVADINLCQICAHKTKLHTDDWQSEAEKIALSARALGISLSQCHLPFKSKKVMWKEPQDYAYYIEMFYRAIDVASYIGIPWAVIHPERYPNRTGMDSAAKLRANREEYDRLIDYALKKNLNIAFENMIGHRDTPDKNYCADAAELAELIDSYNDPRVGACWDTGHANIYYDDQWDALHILGSRLHCTHIQDNRGADDLHLLPYEGLIDWKRVIGALRDIGYPGDLILEGSINYYSPECLKDENGRHAYAVMSCIAEL